VHSRQLPLCSACIGLLAWMVHFCLLQDFLIYLVDSAVNVQTALSSCQENGCPSSCSVQPHLDAALPSPGSLPPWRHCVGREARRRAPASQRRSSCWQQIVCTRYALDVVRILHVRAMDPFNKGACLTAMASIAVYLPHPWMLQLKWAHAFKSLAMTYMSSSTGL
jgi:hypothetical protein